MLTQGSSGNGSTAGGEARSLNDSAPNIAVMLPRENRRNVVVLLETIAMESSSIRVKPRFTAGRPGGGRNTGTYFQAREGSVIK